MIRIGKEENSIAILEILGKEGDVHIKDGTVTLRPNLSIEGPQPREDRCRV